MVRRLSREILQSHSFEVSEAEDGEEALARIASDGMPDLITLDWNMPVMSGLDTLKALREKFGDTVPKVMFCTTNTEVTDIHKGIEAGASEWIVKPFDQASLTAKLAKIGII